MTSQARKPFRASDPESAKPEWAPIGERLASIRGSTSQPEMAALLGVSKTTYGRLERGVREIGADVLRRLIGLGWSPVWLLTGAGDRKLGGGAQRQEGAASQDLSPEGLMVAYELAEEALRGLWLPKHLFFELVALVYDGVTRGLPYAQIIDFARPAASQMAKEKTEDESEQGGGSAVGSKSAGGAAAGAPLLPGQGDW